MADDDARSVNVLRRILLGGGLVGLLLLVGPAQAQERIAVDSVRAAYERLDYEAVKTKARRALDQYEAYSADELAQIHVLLGVVHYAQNDQRAARTQFEQALALKPALELDEVQYAPKIVRFFDQIKEEREENQQEQPEVPSSREVVRYIVRDDPRSQAALRSLILPGAGQFYKGEPAKGWTFVGLWTGGLASTELVDFFRAQARENYLAARGEEDISGAYQRYNRWRWTYDALRMTIVGVWLYSVGEALITETEPPSASGISAHRGPRVQPVAATGHLGLRVTLSF